MSRTGLREFLKSRQALYVIVLGVNEIASAVAARVTQEGRKVVLSHDPFPPVIRRGMAFHDALFDDPVELEGVFGRRAETTMEIGEVLSSTNCVAVTPLALNDVLALRVPDVLIDARIQKHRVTPNLRKIAQLSIGLGPNFSAGFNCDVAIETHPDHTGELLEAGATRSADGVPRYLGGVGRERFMYAARSGVWRTPLDIGVRIFKNLQIGLLDGLPVYAPMDGHLRGLARDGVFVPQNVKLVEMDPRGRASSWTGTDERGRAIAAAASLAIAAHFAPASAPAVPVTLH